MYDTTYSSIDYYRSLNEALEKMIEKEEEDMKNHVFFQSKYRAMKKFELNIQKDITLLYNFDTKSKYEPSENLISSFETLASNISDEEYNSLITSLSEDVDNINNNDKIHFINSIEDKLLKSIEYATTGDYSSIKQKEIVVKDPYTNQSQTMTFAEGIKNLVEHKKNRLKEINVKISIPRKTDENLQEESLIELANSSYLNDEESDKYIKENVLEIADQLKIKRKAETAVKECTSLTYKIEEEQDVNNIKLSKSMKFIEKTLDNKKDEIKSANKKLEHYDLEEYFEIADKYQESKNKKH